MRTAFGIPHIIKRLLTGSLCLVATVAALRVGASDLQPERNIILDAKDLVKQLGDKPGVDALKPWYETAAKLAPMADPSKLLSLLESCGSVDSCLDVMTTMFAVANATGGKVSFEADRLIPAVEVVLARAQAADLRRWQTMFVDMGFRLIAVGGGNEGLNYLLDIAEPRKIAEAEWRPKSSDDPDVFRAAYALFFTYQSFEPDLVPRLQNLRQRKDYQDPKVQGVLAETLEAIEGEVRLKHKWWGRRFPPAE